jgi:hypothetical protein
MSAALKPAIIRLVDSRHRAPLLTAIASISTRASRGNRAAWTVDRAGGSFAK